jgi:kynurenine formamidase
VAGLGLKGLGVDAISLDPTDSRDYAVHHIILGSGMVAVENLTNLEKLPESGFIFIGLPLRFPAGDGSPLRAVAVIGQETGGTF